MNIVDVSKLENVARNSDGSITCGCPACLEQGNDTKGKNHLRVWPNHAFNCVVDNSKEHNARILQLVGTESDGTEESYFVSAAPKNKSEKFWDPLILSELIQNYDYWINRGISAETCAFFQIGVATKGQLTNRSVIPIFSKPKTKIVGFTARALYPNINPKYKHLGAIKQSTVWPYIEGEKYDKILLVESPGCILRLWDYGIKSAKCLFGTNIGPALISYLIETNPLEILIGTNNEPSNRNIGARAALKIDKKLSQFFNEDKIKIALPPTKDFGEMTDEQLSEYQNQWQL